MADPTSRPDGAGETDEGLVSTRPPAAFTLVRTWVVDTLHGLSELRAQVLAAVTPDGAGPGLELDSIAHHMVLVASELATNALRHGIPPTIVQLMRDDRTYLLDVADHDLTTVPYLADGRPPGMGGFGLQIARRLAVDVGWYATGATKHVWARFPVPD